MRSRYGRPVTRHAKEGTDFATSADLASEEAIRAVLAEHRPDDAMIGEEAGRTGPVGAAREWLVDPLCGTRNFAATTPLVAVNVALRADGRVLAAASADPISGEVFWTDGSAALRTSRRCRHSRGAGSRLAAGRRRPRPPPGRRRPAPARGRDVPARLQPEGRLEHARHDLARGRAPGGVRPRGRPAGQRALRGSHRHRRGGRVRRHRDPRPAPAHRRRTVSSPPRTRPRTHGCWRSSPPLAERSPGVQAALTGRTR